MRKMRLLVALVACVAFGVMLLRPRPAEASDVTTPLIISGAVAGGIAVVVLIAIAFADRDEPDFLDALGPDPTAWDKRRPERSVRFGPACRSEAGGYPVLCW